MYDPIIDNAPAISVWKKRWIAQKRKDLLLIIILGTCFAALTGANHILSPDSDSLLAIAVVICIFVLLFIHDFRLLQIRKDAIVSVSNYGVLIEKYPHSKHATSRTQASRGHYAAVRTPHGDTEVVCDSYTYVYSKPGDLLLVLHVENDSHSYGVAINAR